MISQKQKTTSPTKNKAEGKKSDNSMIERIIKRTDEITAKELGLNQEPSGDQPGKISKKTVSQDITFGIQDVLTY